jgi:hypothetical protein
MGCRWIRTADGAGVILCGPRPRPPRRCAICQARPPMRLCDGQILVQRTQTTRLCSVALCVQCAIHVGEDRDYCPTCAPPEHAALAARILEAAGGRRR